MQHGAPFGIETGRPGRRTPQAGSRTCMAKDPDDRSRRARDSVHRGGQRHGGHLSARQHRKTQPDRSSW